MIPVLLLEYLYASTALHCSGQDPSLLCYFVCMIMLPGVILICCNIVVLSVFFFLAPLVCVCVFACARVCDVFAMCVHVFAMCVCV